MSKTASILLTVVLALVLGFAGGFLAQQINKENGSDADVSGLRNKVNSLQATLGDVQNEVKNIETGGGGQESQDLSSVKETVAGLRGRVSDLQERIKNLGDGSSGKPGLEIGYLNAQGAFTVFTDAVGKQREEVKNLQSKLQNLIQKYSNEEIEQEEFRQRYDTLRAKRLQAQLQVDLAMVNKMQKAKGFTSIRNDLKKVEQKIQPLESNLNQLVDNLEIGLVDPQKAENSLSQLKNQFQQLDQMMTNVIEQKMSQVAYGLADQRGYDLVFRQKNVLLYRNSDRINDLTDEVKTQLKKELKAATG